MLGYVAHYVRFVIAPYAFHDVVRGIGALLCQSPLTEIRQNVLEVLSPKFCLHAIEEVISDVIDRTRSAGINSSCFDYYVIRSNRKYPPVAPTSQWMSL